MAGIAPLSSPPSPSPLRPPTRMRPTIYTAPAVSRPESGMSNASSASEMEIPPLQLPHILPIYIDFTPSWYTHAAAIHQLVNGNHPGRYSVTAASISATGNCGREQRCMRCGGPHNVTACQKPAGEKGTCCNCG
ncbi:hypothetical protein J6590_063137 [Homalodisca vitripennis]|nr:hypothetical protein J6590_063137 [Homalodisca vitripennis]